MDYFALLNLLPSFDLNMQALETAYFAQQRLHHPDRFVGKPAEVRQQALSKSVDINQAYNTLKNPLSRAQYVLHLQGIAVGTEGDNVKPSQALLMETMQWREMIEDAQDAAALKKLGGLLSEMQAQSLAGIAASYEAQKWQEMAQETLRLNYLIKSLEAVTLQQKRMEKRAI